MEQRLPLIIRVFGYFKMVFTHKYWVFYYCCKLRMPWRGLLHDMSKLTPFEFMEGIKYYNGKVSPIIKAKEDKGWSKAWFHHRSRNKHHYEYWMDNFDDGGINILMPFPYALEMICDFLAAGKTYDGKDFTYEKELAWWENRKKKPLAMHPALQGFVTACLTHMAMTGELITRDLAWQHYEWYKKMEGKNV